MINFRPKIGRFLKSNFARKSSLNLMQNRQLKIKKLKTVNVKILVIHLPLKNAYFVVSDGMRTTMRVFSISGCRAAVMLVNSHFVMVLKTGRFRNLTVRLQNVCKLLPSQLLFHAYI